jgi:hypothetical protein
MDLFDIKGQLAAELVDHIRPDEIPRLVQSNASLLLLLRQRNPGVVRKLRPWKSLVLSTLDKWDADKILDGLYEERPDHYAILEATPGGFDWFRTHLFLVRDALPTLLGGA